MYSRWDLKISEGKNNLHFVNLATAKSMDIDVPNEMMGVGLLAWMQDQQGHGSSVVFFDGAYIGMIMPMQSDTKSVPVMMEVGEA